MKKKELTLWIIYFAIVAVGFFLDTKVHAKEATNELSPIVVTAKSFKKQRLENQRRFEVFAQRMHDLYQFDKDEVVSELNDVMPVTDSLDAYAPPKKRKKKKDETPEEIAFRFERYVNNGVKFWDKNKDALERAQREYGVLPEITVGLIGIETNYGTYQGKYNVFEALTTLGFYGNHKSEYFRNELENYMILARDMSWNIQDVNGSYAGAIGIPQFMPSAVKPFSVEWDGLHQSADIFHSYDDAIGSAVNFLVQHGWAKNQPIATQVGKKLGKKTFVSHVLPGPRPTVWLKQANYNNLMHYNPSDSYVMSIFILGQRIKMRYTIYLQTLPHTDELKLPDPVILVPEVKAPEVEAPQEAPTP
jgi:membrane-bound lytic murein transglycosylase B